MTAPTLSRKKLFAYLIVDDIQIGEEVETKAKNGNGDSFYEIGNIYYQRKSYTKAIDWYRLGAAKDNVNSQFRLGWMCCEGKGVPVNYQSGMEWYLKAHENGSIKAATNLGYLYGKGQGVLKDFGIALKWYLEAANKGDDCAQFNVGFYYEHGRGGVIADVHYALEWYEKSAEQGYELAKKQIKLLNEKGFYMDDRQKKYLQMEKDMEKQKAKLESLQERLKLSEQKRQQAEQKMKRRDVENTLLRQEVNAQRETCTCTYTKQKPHLKEGTVNQLGESVTKMNTGEDNLENDIYYDGETHENNRFFDTESHENDIYCYD
ncbi:HCP-like protein, partial [Backusella circina FSU 941]